MQYDEILTFEGSTTKIIFVLVVPISETALLYVTDHKFRPLVLLTAAQEAGEHDYGAFMERY
jgi:hypothetical protein